MHLLQTRSMIARAPAACERYLGRGSAQRHGVTCLCFFDRVEIEGVCNKFCLEYRRQCLFRGTHLFVRQNLALTSTTYSSSLFSFKISFVMRIIPKAKAKGFGLE